MERRRRASLAGRASAAEEEEVSTSASSDARLWLLRRSLREGYAAVKMGWRLLFAV